jgi:hypothetical protein
MLVQWHGKASTKTAGFFGGDNNTPHFNQLAILRTIYYPDVPEVPLVSNILCGRKVWLNA